MKFNVGYLCLFGLLFTGAGLSAQPLNSMYFMYGIPQAGKSNPALQPACNFYLGLPALNSTGLEVSSQPLSIGDLIYPRPGSDSLMTFLHPEGDIDAFLDQLKALNHILFDFGSSLFQVGFRTGAGFFTLEVNSRVEANLSYPGDLVRVALKGFENEVNYQWDGLGLNLSAYNEFALGWSKKLGNRWSVGARGKLLFGIANLHTRVSDLDLYTSLDSWNLNSDIELVASLPFASVVYDEENLIEDLIVDQDLSDLNPSVLPSYALNPGNLGFGVDLGVDFRPGDRWHVSASILDLGFIRWKEEVHQLRYSRSYEFTGLEIDPLDFSEEQPFDSYLDSSLSALADTLYTGLETGPAGAYGMRLNTKIFIGASYNLTPSIRLGLVSRTDIRQRGIWEQLTATANFRAGRILNWTLSYSHLSLSDNQLGMGLALNAGPLNFYIISDNALSVPLWTGNVRSLNMWLGFNLVFGYKERPDLPLIY